MFQLAMHSLKLVWGLGQAAGDGAGREVAWPFTGGQPVPDP